MFLVEICVITYLALQAVVTITYLFKATVFNLSTSMILGLTLHQSLY